MRHDEPPGRGQPPAWLQATLFERRIVFVTGRLDDTVAARAAAELMSLDAGGDEPIELYLDSAEGTLEAALVLVDTLDLLGVTARAHCWGQAGGPAIGVLAVADHRSASPHARFRLAEPTIQFSGSPDRLAAESRQQRELLRRFQARLARATGRSAEEIARDMRQGRHLDARQALEYGLIDAIRAPRP